MLGDPTNGKPEMTEPSLQRGVCPGVWAPMPSGDGLLVRVRAPRARLNAQQIRGLSSAARRFGNGIVELTRRGNLQLRGAADTTLPDLQAELLRLGLASLTAAAERRPSLSVCPFDGVDPRRPLLGPLAEALEALLAEPELTRHLSHKFSLLLSSGSTLFDELRFDLRVDASRAGRALLSVAGTALGTCGDEAVAGAVRTLLVWLGATVPAHARMSQLLDARGGAALAGALQLEPAPCAARWAAEYLGFHSVDPEAVAAAEGYFGFELPFGALEASDWDHVAELAERYGTGEVRLLPARALLLPGVRESSAAALAQQARARRFGVERSPLRLVACSGAPACRSARGETRRFAIELASLLPENGALTLHVSGCEKSCAWSGAADITVLHGEAGARLGFDTSVAETARTAPLDGRALRQRVAARFAGRHTQAPEALRHTGAPA
jgi:precorrin-3B synthase